MLCCLQANKATMRTLLDQYTAQPDAEVLRAMLPYMVELVRLLHCISKIRCL